MSNIEKKQIKFLQDENGNFSSTRLVFVVMIAYTLIMGVLVYKTEGSTAAIAYITAISGVASALKLGDKVTGIKKSE